MKIAIASAALVSIVDHARRATPDEACGILFGNGSGIAAAEPAANVAANPKRAFEIDPAALLRAHRDARREGRAVVGWYHSHPNGVAEPSATDAARAVEDGRLWLIAGVGEGGEGAEAPGISLAAWRVVADGPVQGRFAPVMLVAA